VIINEDFDAPGYQASCPRLLVQAAALRPDLLKAPVRVQHDLVAILGQKPVAPGEYEADRFARCVDRYDLVHPRETRCPPPIDRVINLGQFHLGRPFPFRNRGVEMVDEFIQDGIPDPAFEVAEEGFGNRTILSRWELKVQTPDDGVVEGRGKLKNAVSHPAPGLVTTFPGTGLRNAGPEIFGIFHDQGDRDQGRYPKPPVSDAKDVIEGTEGHGLGYCGGQAGTRS
jgi:hypothetical protein